MPTETLNATRLIDANAFKKVLRELANTTDHPDEFNGIESCIRKLESAPTVDISELQEKAKALDDINRKIRQL